MLKMLARMLKKRDKRSRSRRREEMHAQLIAMGYQVVDSQGRPWNGIGSLLAYVGIAPDGTRLDGDGAGYARLTYLRAAILEHAKKDASASNGEVAVGSMG